MVHEMYINTTSMRRPSLRPSINQLFDSISPRNQPPRLNCQGMMNPRKPFILLNFMLLACAFAKSAGSENYESGPLPSIRMKKAALSKKMTMRVGPSPTPCMICCRQQRTVDRMCTNLEEEQAEFKRACAAVQIATAGLSTAQGALSANQKEISSSKRSLSDMLSQISDLQGEFFGGNIGKIRREEVRGELLPLRRESKVIRARLIRFRRARGPLIVAIEDAGAELEDAQKEKKDEQSMMDRASRRKARAQRSMGRCLARTGSQVA